VPFGAALINTTALQQSTTITRSITQSSSTTLTHRQGWGKTF
jgi:hypothetical protein